MKRMCFTGSDRRGFSSGRISCLPRPYPDFNRDFLANVREEIIQVVKGCATMPASPFGAATTKTTGSTKR